MTDRNREAWALWLHTATAPGKADMAAVLLLQSCTLPRGLGSR